MTQSANEKKICSIVTTKLSPWLQRETAFLKCGGGAIDRKSFVRTSTGDGKKYLQNKVYCLPR